MRDDRRVDLTDVSDDSAEIASQVDLCLERARDFFNDQDFEMAKECFALVLKVDAEHSDALNGYATCLCELNQGAWTEEAIDALVAALRSDPKNAKAWNNIGDVHYRRGEFDLAIDYFQKAVKNDSKFGIAYVNLALAFRNTRRTMDALRAISQALVLNPHCGWTRFQLGLTYLYRGCSLERALDFEKAHEVFLSIKELGLVDSLGHETSEADLDQMIRYSSAYQTIGKTSESFRRFLTEHLQFFGDERDDEVFSHLLN